MGSSQMSLSGKFLHSPQDAQSIKKTLSPPSVSLCTRGHPGAGGAAPLKLLLWWPPGMPVALGTGRAGQDGGGLDNRSCPVGLLSCSRTAKPGQQRDWRHFRAQLNPALRRAHVHVHMHISACKRIPRGQVTLQNHPCSEETRPVRRF